MPIVDIKGVLNHAQQNGYTIGTFRITDLASITHIIGTAEQSQSPVVLSVNGSEGGDLELLITAAECAAERATVPVALHLNHCKTLEQAIEAIRFGCNSLATDISSPEKEELERVEHSVKEMAQGCGIAVVSLPQAAPDQSVEQQIDQWGSVGQADAVLQHAAPWSPVEHLIIFNADATPEAVHEMMTKGREILQIIPGVRRVFIGDAVQKGASYRFSWVIRFCHPAVIDSYRDHPDHVTFADDLFRPVAGDRISIDYLAL